MTTFIYLPSNPETHIDEYLNLLFMPQGKVVSRPTLKIQNRILKVQEQIRLFIIDICASRWRRFSARLSPTYVRNMYVYKSWSKCVWPIIFVCRDLALEWRERDIE